MRTLCLAGALLLWSASIGGAVAVASAQETTETTDENAIASYVLGGDASLKKQSLKSKFKSDEELGVENEVLAAWKSGNGCVVKTLIHHGTEYYEDPTMVVFVGIAKDGTITGVQIGETVDHTPAYLDTVTQDYLDESFAGQRASSSFVTDAVAGATYSSDAVLYGVRLASWYAANALRIGDREKGDVQLKQLQAVVPGTFEKVEASGDFACEEGTVQYVAKGTSEAGDALWAIVTQAIFTPSDPHNNMAMPTFQVWFREEDNTVCLAHMQAGRFYDGFAMEEEKLESYYGIEIITGEEFTDYTEGLITEAPEYILTSATQSFPDAVTGATPEGNDTSLAVRNCLITAAKYYSQEILGG